MRDRVSTKRRKVVLSVTPGSRSGTRVSHYIRIPTEVRSITGLRGGLIRNRFAINDQDHGSVTGGIPNVGTGGVIADDGTKFGAAVDNYNSPYYNTKGVTNMSLTGFYIGICKAEYVNVTIDANGYGRKSNRTYFKMYADVMVAAPYIQDFQTADGKTHKV